MLLLFKYILEYVIIGFSIAVYILVFNNYDFDVDEDENPSEFKSMFMITEIFIMLFWVIIIPVILIKSFKGE